MAETPAPPVSGRQSFLARHHGRRTETMESPEDIAEAGMEGTAGRRSPLARAHSLAGMISVEHLTDEKVRMWKRGPRGWVPREVPVSAIANNLQNGWMEYCPDCGTSTCTMDPNSCPAKVGTRFITCPVPGCNSDHRRPKRIYSTGLGATDLAPSDPNEIASPYTRIDVEAELRGKMDVHIRTYHRDEAVILGLFGRASPTADRRIVPGATEDDDDATA